MDSVAKKGELQQLKDVVRKVFEYTPPAKGAGGQDVSRKRETKDRRSERAREKLARLG